MSSSKTFSGRRYFAIILGAIGFLLQLPIEGQFGRPEECGSEPTGLSFGVFVGTPNDLNKAQCIDRASACTGPTQGWTFDGTLLYGNYQDYSEYYHDCSQPGGRDGKAKEGIDQWHLGFYVGRGTPEKWWAGMNYGRVDRTVIGNPSGECVGNLRYLLMCGCQVMAHGRKVPELGGLGRVDYISPDSFEWGAADHRNVYKTWDRALGQDLRMACGGSSMVCDEGDGLGRDFWSTYLNKACPLVPDTFIGAFYKEWAVPLCIARGGASPEESALWDKSFTPKAGSAEDWLSDEEDAFLHIQFPVAAALRDSGLGGSREMIEKWSTGIPESQLARMEGIELPEYEIQVPSRQELLAWDRALKDWFEVEGERGNGDGRPGQGALEKGSSGGRAWVDPITGWASFWRDRAPTPRVTDTCSGLVLSELTGAGQRVLVRLEASEEQMRKEGWLRAELRPAIMCIHSSADLGENFKRSWKSTLREWQHFLSVCDAIEEGECRRRGIEGVLLGRFDGGGKLTMETVAGEEAADLNRVALLLHKFKRIDRTESRLSPVEPLDSVLRRAESEAWAQAEEFLRLAGEDDAGRSSVAERGGASPERMSWWSARQVRIGYVEVESARGTRELILVFRVRFEFEVRAVEEELTEALPMSITVDIPAQRRG